MHLGQKKDKYIVATRYFSSARQSPYFCSDSLLFKSLGFYNIAVAVMATTHTRSRLNTVKAVNPETTSTGRGKGSQSTIDQDTLPPAGQLSKAALLLSVKKR